LDAVEIIFLGEAVRTICFPVVTLYRITLCVRGARGFIDDVILPHETRKRICPAHS
jgi:hypothetical protein